MIQLFGGRSAVSDPLVNQKFSFVKEKISSFTDVGLVPSHDLYWMIQGWGTTFSAKENIEKGDVFSHVDDLTAENVFSERRIKIIPKFLMAYELRYGMTEMGILSAAVYSGILRHRDDFFGRQTFFDYPNFHNMQLDKTKDVNVFDFYQIAVRHSLPKEFFGRKLPENKNIHFFPEIEVEADNKLERVLKTFHILLRVDKQGKLSATAHAFIPSFRWNRGDLCIFSVHPDFLPKIMN